MKKCIVKPIGNFILLNSNGEDITLGRPSVTSLTSFVESKVLSGLLKMYARGLPKQATDEEFKKFLKDSENEDLAVAAYAAKFGLTEFGDNLGVDLENPVNEISDIEENKENEDVKPDENPEAEEKDISGEGIEEISAVEENEESSENLEDGSVVVQNTTNPDTFTSSVR